MTQVATQRDWLLQDIKPEAVIEHVYAKNGFCFEIVIPKGDLRTVAKRFLEKEYFLECHTVVDYPDRFESVYQFNQWNKVDRVLVKVRAEKN